MQDSARPEFLPICPAAHAATAYGLIDREKYLLSIGCRRSDCAICSALKKKILIARIVRANPTKFLTLTCRHEDGIQNRLAIMRKAWPKMLKWLRTKSEEVQYLRMLEYCKDGYPHFHFLLRMTFVKRELIKEQWKALTQAHIIDIRKAHGKSTAYIAKYLGKHRTQSGEPTRQRMAVSHGFFPPDTDETNQPIGFEHFPEHPATYAVKREDVASFTRTGHTKWLISDRQPGDALPIEFQPNSITEENDNADEEMEIAGPPDR